MPMDKLEDSVAPSFERRQILGEKQKPKREHPEPQQRQDAK